MHRLSQDPLSKKVRSFIRGEKVDLSNIPTFRDPHQECLNAERAADQLEIARSMGRYDPSYPLFLHRDGTTYRIGAAAEDESADLESQARLTSDLPVVSDSPTLRVVRNLDFLKVSFWVEWGSCEGSFLSRLEAMKKQVQDTELDCIPVFQESGFDWNLFRTGAKMYTYRIKSGDITLLFNRRKADGKIPNCRMEIGSLSCWSPGFFEIYQRVKAFLTGHGGRVKKERVSEVHLAADFVGTDIKESGLDNRGHWIAKARNESLYDSLDTEPDEEEPAFDCHYSNRKFSGLNIGTGNLMLRIYDKVMELKRTRATNKQEVFAEIWGCDSYQEKAVTRVEYQIRRPKLREFAKSEEQRIDTVSDLCNALKSLWAYLTTEWTRHADSPVNRNHNQTKARISEFWRHVQAVVWTGVFGYIRTHPPKHKDIVMLRKQARGILMSVCASLEVAPDDIDKIVHLCKEVIEEDLHAFFEDEKAFVDKMTTKRNEFRATLAG